jgi:hypothetical protein
VSAVVALLLLTAGGAQRVAAWSASAVLTPNPGGTALGSGGATTQSSPNASVTVNLSGAQANAVYAVFSCIALSTGDFDCVGLNIPPAFQQVKVMPRALAPIVVTLVQQGTIQTNDSGNASATIPLQSLLIPDTPRSQYNVVELINTADASDAYTALDLQRPLQPVAGVSQITPTQITTALGVPVYVFAQFPGYVYPVAITTVNGAPFVPSIVVPGNVFFGTPFGFTQGLCPNGLPPHAVPGPGGQIFFTC